MLLYRILSESNNWEVNSKRCLLYRILSECNYWQADSKRCLLYRILSESNHWEVNSKRCLLYRILNESVDRHYRLRAFCTPLLLVTLDFYLTFQDLTLKMASFCVTHIAYHTFFTVYENQCNFFSVPFPPYPSNSQLPTPVCSLLPVVVWRCETVTAPVCSLLPVVVWWWEDSNCPNCMWWWEDSNGPSLYLTSCCSGG